MKNIKIAIGLLGLIFMVQGIQARVKDNNIISLGEEMTLGEQLVKGEITVEQYVNRIANSQGYEQKLKSLRPLVYKDMLTRMNAELGRVKSKIARGTIDEIDAATALLDQFFDLITSAKG